MSQNPLKLNSFSDFGEQCHTKNSEPYYYESAYLYDNSDSQLDSPIAIPVNTNGICYVARISSREYLHVTPCYLTQDTTVIF